MSVAEETAAAFVSGRVLFIDDEEDVRVLVRLLLEPLGWQVNAVNATEGLERCRAEPPDVLIVDYQMPEMTGTELARAVRSLGYEGPLVLYSACLTPAVEDEARSLGMSMVQKPALGSLVEVLDAVV